MSRLKQVTPEMASPELKKVYSDMNPVINIFQIMGNAPEILKAFLNMNATAAQTSLDPKLREAIALAVAETNQCGYCLSAHSFLAQQAGMSSEEVKDARQCKSNISKNESVLNFVRKVVESRANISESDLSDLRSIGITDKEVVEIIFVIMLNIFTNYFNHIADTNIDFPKVEKL